MVSNYFSMGGVSILLSSSSNIERETGLRHNGAGLQLWRGEQLKEPVKPNCCVGELLAVLLQQAPADCRRPQYTDGLSSSAGKSCARGKGILFLLSEYSRSFMFRRKSCLRTTKGTPSPGKGAKRKAQNIEGSTKHPRMVNL